MIFKDAYRFLSNFYPVTINYRGALFPSVEHAYQGAKCHSPRARETIRRCPTPGRAKQYGRRVNPRENWVNLKYGVMEELLRQKFSINPLKQMLLDTAPQRLVEDNHWGDTYWGVCNGEGENHLGKLLMQIRAELVAQGATSR